MAFLMMLSVILRFTLMMLLCTIQSIDIVFIWLESNVLRLLETNLSLVADLFLHPLKTSENHWFCDVFREYRKGLVAWNGLK